MDKREELIKMISEADDIYIPMLYKSTKKKLKKMRKTVKKAMKVILKDCKKIAHGKGKFYTHEEVFGDILDDTDK